jgi:hypothetical protein
MPRRGWKMTYREIKVFLEGLSANELDQTAIVSGVDGSPTGYITQAEILTEDWINPSGDGVEPVSIYEDNPKDIEDEPIVLHKGQVLLTSESGVKP